MMPPGQLAPYHSHSRGFVMNAARLALHLAVVLAIPGLWDFASTPASAASAFAQALGGSSGNPGTWASEGFKTDTQNHTALAESSGQGIGGNWSALAFSDSDPRVQPTLVTLKASADTAASAGLPIREDFLGIQPAVVAFAKASWTDTVKLHVSGPQPFEAFDHQLYFYAHVEGRASLNTVSFLRMQIGEASQQTTFVGAALNTQQLFYDDLKIKYPASILSDLLGVSFYLDLTLSVSAVNDREMGFINGSADFSNTAVLDAVYLGDPDGNPVPVVPGLQLVGDSGLVYPVLPLPVPEPSSFLLALLGAAIVEFTRGQQVLPPHRNSLH
jgi:hypothetical protein